MSEIFGFDAFSPTEIAVQVEKIGVAKARLPLLSMLMLSILAGAFIGLGALYFALVKSEPTLSFATERVLGRVAFSLGLLLVIVTGAVLSTRQWPSFSISPHSLRQALNIASPTCTLFRWPC